MKGTLIEFFRRYVTYGFMCPRLNFICRKHQVDWPLLASSSDHLKMFLVWQLSSIVGRRNQSLIILTKGVSGVVTIGLASILIHLLDLLGNLYLHPRYDCHACTLCPVYILHTLTSAHPHACTLCPFHKLHTLTSPLHLTMHSAPSM